MRNEATTKIRVFKGKFAGLPPENMYSPKNSRELYSKARENVYMNRRIRRKFTVQNTGNSQQNHTNIMLFTITPPALPFQEWEMI